MKARVELWKSVSPFIFLYIMLTFRSQVTFLRKTRGSRLNIFAPVSDLSSLAKSEIERSELEAGPMNDIAVAGGQVLGDEWTTHVVEVRDLGYHGLTSTYILFIEPNWNCPSCQVRLSYISPNHP